MLRRDVTVRRAEGRLGERGYNLFFGNCEHFATWCRTGAARSSQVELAARMLISPFLFVPPPVRVFRALISEV